MGILINKQKTILGTIDINQMYLRLEITLNRHNRLNVKSYAYHSKEAFQLNPSHTIRLDHPDGIEEDQFNDSKLHDRKTNDPDILLEGHNLIFNKLTTDKTKTVIARNEDGTEKKDKDGNVITETITIQEAYATKEEVSVDLDTEESISK